ncbi:MAG: hypothetical protein NC489_45215 [Ruminococcus flavefaciens]|nr:hypothetical protein [Ruminococcus flavefaciens]
MMKITNTVLKCNNCDPNYELDELNPRWSSGEKQAKYYKNFVGIYKTGNFPADYNEKLDQLICPFCNSKLVDTNFPHDDFTLIGKVTDWNRQVLDAMMELHENDPIEYQLKLNQFKQQQEQQDMAEQRRRNENKVHCPYCNSVNVKKISATSKAVNTALFGIFGTKRNKQWHCEKCGSDF